MLCARVWRKVIVIRDTKAQEKTMLLDDNDILM